MFLGCYHMLNIAWFLQVDKPQRNYVLSCPVSSVLPHWTRTDGDCRQGGQFSLNIILCIWKPHLLNTRGVLNTTTSAAFALLTEQRSLVSPEKRVRGGPAPQLSPAFISCTCGSDTGITYATRSVFRGIARNELKGSFLEIEEFISPGILPVKHH